MKWLKWLVIAAVVAWAGWWLWQRVFVTDEQRVRQLLGSLTQAVETGDVVKLSNGITGDYSDNLGLDKASLVGAVRSFRAQYDAILIHLADVTITIEPNHQQAETVLIAKVLAKPRVGIAETELRADRFHLFFRKTSDGWKLFRAESPELKFE